MSQTKFTYRHPENDRQEYLQLLSCLQKNSSTQLALCFATYGRDWRYLASYNCYIVLRHCFTDIFLKVFKHFQAWLYRSKNYAEEFLLHELITGQLFLGLNETARVSLHPPLKILHVSLWWRRKMTFFQLPKTHDLALRSLPSFYKSSSSRRDC